MAWFSHFLAGIFGRKQAHSSKHNIQKPSLRDRADIDSDIKSEYQPHTLGFALKHCPPTRPGKYAYDLNNRPALEIPARDRLSSQINEIPPMPEIWQRVQEILQQDDASASDLGQCVAQDPVLTAQILKVCNSSAYAGTDGAEVSNIPLAIARLGLDETSTIIFRSLAPDLGVNKQQKTEIRQIWFHSQAIAMISRTLAEPSQHLSRHDATLTGMLHDIGKLVILHIESAQQLNRLKTMMNAGTPSLAAEQEVLGYTHIDAGMMLALHWKLPRHIQQSISLHHHPAATKSGQLPERVRHAMLTLHIAHLVLQQSNQSDTHPTEQAKESSNNTSIWQPHQRTCLHDTLRFAQQEMLLSLQSESFYSQIEADIMRLKLSFSDLFPSK